MIELASARVLTPGQHMRGYPNPDDELSVWFDAESEEIEWHAHYTWDSLMDEEKTYCGRATTDRWLESLAVEYLNPTNQWRLVPDIPGFPVHILHHNREPVPHMSAKAVSEVAATIHHFTQEPLRSHCFLDSFSIIENGECAKRYERMIEPSATTKVLIGLAHDASIASLSPRAFETLVASALAEVGFSNVTLRRYTKDSGVDIIAMLLQGERDETVVVEVKYSKRPTGLRVLDRLNGVRDRLDADRALLVTSSYITRDARTAYTARSSYVAAYTLSELLTVLGDSPDWESTPSGLWLKLP